MNKYTYFDNETHILAKYVKRKYSGMLLEIGQNKKIKFDLGNPVLDWMAYIDYILPRKQILTENYCNENLHKFAENSNFEYIWVVFDDDGNKVTDNLMVKRLMAKGSMTYLSPPDVATLSELKLYCKSLFSKECICQVCKQKVQNKLIYNVNNGLCISYFKQGEGEK